jgi:glycosyltransferase involved in cell wall biosynthesis
VLDSGSTDRTCDLARAGGAGVYVNPFESFGKQRNWALDHIPVKHDWIFHLDADERFTPELVAEMNDVLSRGPDHAGYFVPSKLMFMGRWLRRSGRYPTYQMRLFHRHRMRFCDYGHGQREETTGTLGRLQQPYLHFNFSKGLADWIDKHNRYSTLEAANIVATRSEPLGLGRLWGSDPVERRRALKRLWYRAPLRPQLRWAGMMFASGGVLEGAAGRTYASLMALYERMIDLKVKLLLADRAAAATARSRPSAAEPDRAAG